MSIEPVAVNVLPEVMMNDELSKAIRDAVSTADVKALLIAAAEQQAVTSAQLAADQAAAETTRLAAETAAQAAAAAASVSFARTETIGGKEFHFDGESEAEVDRLVLNAYKVAYAVREEKPAVAEAIPDAAAVAAAAEAEVAAKADLERKFRLGEVSAADYIQQSGALTQFLESNGISVEALKETVNANLGAKVAQSWAQAGEAFRNSPTGQDWPGGERNQEIIGLKLVAMGLEGAEDKVAAIAQAYAELKKSRAYFPYGDFNTEAEWKTANGKTVAAPVLESEQEAAAAAQASAAAASKTRSTSSSMFGQSSGTSGAPVTAPAVVAAKKVVPENATPAEILQAWKEAQIAAGIDPNAAFTDTYKTGRI